MKIEVISGEQCVFWYYFNFFFLEMCYGNLSSKGEG